MEAIDDCALEFPGRNTLLEEEIELSVSSALWFRKTEERPDEAAKASSSVEEATLCAPIPSTRVEHAWGDDVADNGTEVVEVPGQDNRLLAETGGWDLCDD